VEVATTNFAFLCSILGSFTLPPACECYDLANYLGVSQTIFNDVLILKEAFSPIPGGFSGDSEGLLREGERFNLLGRRYLSNTALSLSTLTRVVLLLVPMPATAKPLGNVPMAALHWSIERASREFNLAPVTLSKFLRQSDAVPDESGCYSTAQLCSAIYGDLRAERLRKERELTKRYRLENEITEGNLVNKTAILQGFASLADAMVCRIMSSALEREVKEDLLRELSTIPVVVKDASKQTRSRAVRNGQEEEQDESETASTLG
jgi:hypothetical protein